MAITYNLPIRDWYQDTTSEWTLDYPPLFAAFEFLLALIAHALNLHETLALTKDIIRSEYTIVYQKVTVVIADLVYYYGVYSLCTQIEPLLRHAELKTKNQTKVHQEETKSCSTQRQCLLDAIYRPDTTSAIALLLLVQPGLLLVDHIHFQYNGLLSGIFLLSIASIVSGNYISGSFLFAVLLNFKHIYLYCAPAYGMYLLASYCLAKAKGQSRILSFAKRTSGLGLIVLLVFVITYLPFADLSTLKQIINRLFPFKRGLTHAYWAPNFWSIYNTADKILTAGLGPQYRDVNFDLDSISGKKQISSSSGLVQEYEHQYLPSVRPVATFILVGLFTFPLVIKFVLNLGKCSPALFMKGVTLAAFTSFMFGWHVHEKAVLVFLLPLIPISFIDTNLKPILLRLMLVGTYSLFPLLFQPAEYLTKLALLIAYYCYARSLNISDRGRKTTASQSSFLRSQWHRVYNLLDKTFILALVLIEIYNTVIHGRFNYHWNPLAKLNRYDFLPLMLTSSFSALGITVSYLELYYDFVFCKAEDEAAAA